MIETWVRKMLLGRFKSPESHIGEAWKKVSLSIESGESPVE